MEAFQGWAADPFGAHEARFFSQGRPTSLVRDGDVESYDAPPADVATGAPAPPATLWAPPFSPPERSALPTSSSTAASGASAPSPFEVSMDTFAVPAPSPAPKSTKRPVVAIVAALVVVLAVVGSSIVFVTGGKSAEAAVIDSVNATLADHTAHVSMTISGGAGGVTLDGTGSGVIDFTQNAMALQATINAAGQRVQIQEIYLGGVMYESIPGLAQLVPGKTWLSIDVSSLQRAAGQDPSTLGSISNPSEMLRVLAQQGNTVAPLGSSSIGGVDVQGYSVTFDPSSIKSRLAHAPSWMQQALTAVNFQDLKLNVFVDGSGLLRRMTMHMKLAAASAGAVSADVSLDFSDFGTPVSVSAPPADQVVGFEQFVQAAQGAASSSSP